MPHRQQLIASSRHLVVTAGNLSALDTMGALGAMNATMVAVAAGQGETKIEGVRRQVGEITSGWRIPAEIPRIMNVVLRAGKSSARLLSRRSALAPSTKAVLHAIFKSWTTSTGLVTTASSMTTVVLRPGIPGTAETQQNDLARQTDPAMHAMSPRLTKKNGQPTTAGKMTLLAAVIDRAADLEAPIEAVVGALRIEGLGISDPGLHAIVRSIATMGPIGLGVEKATVPKSSQ